MGDRSLFSDIRGGALGALLSIPSALALGPLFFAPLGAEYLPLGIYSAIIAIAMGNIGASLFKGNPYIITGPSIVGTMMISAAVSSLAIQFPELLRTEIILIVFLLVLMSGVMQILFGILKLGFLIKYIPYPVLAGLVNGTALSIIIRQGGRLIYSGGGGIFASAPLILAAGTIAGVLLSSRISEKIPSTIIGIIAGYLLFTIMRLTGFGDDTIMLLGRVPSGIPRPEYGFGFIRILFNTESSVFIIRIIPIAFSIALVNSLRSLMTLVSLDGLSFERSDCDAELVGQGAGNMLSSFFGGAATSGIGSSSSANYSAGATGSRSKIFAGFFALLSLMLFNPLLSRLPVVILTAVIFMFGLMAFDRWSLSQLSRFFRERKKKELSADMGIMATVALTLLLRGVFEAVAAGILISLVVFSIKMGRDVVRRKATSKDIRSSVHRRREELDALDEHGEEILFLELDGVLFFGTTDKLAKKIYELAQPGIKFIILDFKRVSEIDSTGANILLQVDRKCESEGIMLLLSSICRGSCSSEFLGACGVLEVFGEQRVFSKADYALSWAEDQVVFEILGADSFEKQELQLREIDVFKKFEDKDLDYIQKYFEKREYASGSRIFSQGDESDGIYFISMGRARIYAREPGGGLKRLGTLSRGASFGEISAIDGKPRSATVMTEKDMNAYFISKAALEKLGRKKPRLAFAFLTGISREMARRFRIANRISVDLG